MRYLFPPTLKTVRSPTKDAGANIAFRSPGMRQVVDSIASTQRHIASAAWGSRSMKSRIRLSDTILTSLGSHIGNCIVKRGKALCAPCTWRRRFVPTARNPGMSRKRPARIERAFLLSDAFLIGEVPKTAEEAEQRYRLNRDLSVFIDSHPDE